MFFGFRGKSLPPACTQTNLEGEKKILNAVADVQFKNVKFVALMFCNKN